MSSIPYVTSFAICDLNKVADFDFLFYLTFVNIMEMRGLCISIKRSLGHIERGMKFIIDQTDFENGGYLSFGKKRQLSFLTLLNNLIWTTK